MSRAQSPVAGRMATAVATLAAAICLPVLIVLGGATFALAGGAAGDAQTGAPPADVSALARADIPPSYLRLYVAAAERYGLDWSILAGIGRVECDHGRDPSPSCTKEGAENSAGAGGPMQFLASTWAAYGVDGDGDGRIDRWSPADAIFSAAHYLRAGGAPGDYRKAIYAYNHAWWYVSEVLTWAARYRGAANAGDAHPGTDSAAPGGAPLAYAQATLATSAAGRAISPQASETPVLYVPGAQAKLLRSDGHVALIPDEAPAAVQAMIVAGNELQQLPYGAAGHPDPLGAASEDCSSTINYVLYRAGIRPLSEITRDNPLAQDYVHWGARGPGRWVTIYSTDLPTPHVFIVIAGLRLDTVGGGTDEGPNRDQQGPRWRLLPYIPTWAHWSVRHPPGL